MPNETYYKILGIKEDASKSEIREAYKELALKWHPDKNLNNIQEATEIFEKVQKAYEVLSNPSERASYDKKLNQERNEQQPWFFDLKSPVASFTGREEELKDLHSKVQRSSTDSRTTIKRGYSGSTTVIVGPGGVGKSELARKYAHKHYQDYDGNVIWINAESHETLAESFYRLAKDELGIDTKDVDGGERDIKYITEDVYEYFGGKKSLFIFDNAVKAGSTEKVDNGIMNFLPLCLHPTYNKPDILITSCNQYWYDLSLNISKLSLNELSEQEATELIKSGLGITNKLQDREVKQLAETLGYFPSALQEAIAYIKDQRVTGKFEISDYLKEYKKYTRKLLDFKRSKDSSDSYNKTTFAAWRTALDKLKQGKHIDKSLIVPTAIAVSHFAPNNISEILSSESFNHIIELESAIQCNKSLRILETISYFAPDNISAMLFSESFSHRVKLDSAIHLLSDCSMINLKNGCIGMHTLAKQVIRIELKEQGKEEEVLSKALDLLKKPLQERKFDEVSSHAESVLNYASEYKGLKEKCEEVKSLLLPNHSLSQTTAQNEHKVKSL